ncbi:MAG: hypothetical protein PQJ61_11380 [Spirochaetales bacterium]|uniref:Uncharacterized protein n=1 Tax=Candidatus Thalassospirochaeta sargassi TaxID=3119039 RepID=A0AAJ1IDJ3_9SPIO|nr:hypothetical protein [Spirochaetales bacterium]
MKKFLVLILALMLFTGVASVFSDAAEDAFNELVNTLVGTMEGDFSLLLDGLGQDLDPILMQNALDGQNIGMAELGSKRFNHFYFSILPTVSITAANGVFTFTDTQAYEDSLVLKGMLDSILFDEEEGLLGSLLANEDYEVLADVLLNKATPIPALKLNAGAKLPSNIELLLYGMWVPPFLWDMIPADTMSSLPDGLMPTFNYLNIGAELRYVLLRDSKDTPGVSIGLGGAYNHLLLGVGLGDLLYESLGDSLGTIPASFGADYNPFEDAGMEFSSDTIVLGINTTISKKLAVLYPFIKLGAYYAITDFSGIATLTETAVIEGGDGHNDMDMLVSTGFDLMLGPLGTNLTVDYNLGSGVWGLDLGSRLQF